MSDVTATPSAEGPDTGEDAVVESPEVQVTVGEAEFEDEAPELSTEALADGALAEAPLTELELALAERNEWRDRAQRIAADFENYRRRMTAQHADEVDRSTGRLAESLLPVLDACEAAFLQHPAEIEPLFNLMLSELKKQGLESMNLHEQPFDPHLADAVLHEPGDGEPVVSEVLRSGYIWNGKVLRPAMVKVRG